MISAMKRRATHDRLYILRLVILRLRNRVPAAHGRPPARLRKRAEADPPSTPALAALARLLLKTASIVAQACATAACRRDGAPRHNRARRPSSKRHPLSGPDPMFAVTAEHKAATRPALLSTMRQKAKHLSTTRARFSESCSPPRRQRGRRGGMVAAPCIP